MLEFSSRPLHPLFHVKSEMACYVGTPSSQLQCDRIAHEHLIMDWNRDSKYAPNLQARFFHGFFLKKEDRLSRERQTLFSVSLKGYKSRQRALKKVLSTPKYASSFAILVTEFSQPAQ